MTWSVGKEMPFVPNGLNSKPTFDRFGGVFYLGWQEATRIGGCHRSVFNVDISRDGRTWERKYRFETPESFQYPTFHEHDGVIWLSVSQSDHGGSTDRIMFGKLEEVGRFESQAGKKRIEWPTPPAEPAVMQRGVKLFTDRSYTLQEMPDAVKGLTFLRISIENTDVKVTRPGTLYALTPTERPRAASQEKALRAAGFEKVDVPEVQFFPGEINRVSLCQKAVESGERLRFRKLVFLVMDGGTEIEVYRPVPPKPWSENEGELLDNGIRLPKTWPPDNMIRDSREPMPVPYLEYPPEIIPIDVGRQLFVDDFLIEATETFNNTEPGFGGQPRRIQIGWQGGRLGQLSTPTELTLRTTPLGLCVCKQPAREINSPKMITPTSKSVSVEAIGGPVPFTTLRAHELKSIWSRAKPCPFESHLSWYNQPHGRKSEFVSFIRK